MTAGRRTVEVSHPDKVLFPDTGVTKAELAGYYRDLALRILPYLRDRPLVMARYPTDGPSCTRAVLGPRPARRPGR